MIQRRRTEPMVRTEKQHAVRPSSLREVESPIKIPRRTGAALALMQIGIRDYGMIASAAGLTEREVKCIDMADDPQVKELGVRGIPFGQYFHLRQRVRCPKCAARITVAPCVACQIREAGRAEKPAWT